MKKHWMTTLVNFAVLNVFALLPLSWIALGWMPDQVKVMMKGEAPSPVVVADGVALQGQEDGRWEGGKAWKFYLKEGMEWKELAFRLPEAMDASQIESVSLEKWKLLSLRKTGAELEREDGKMNDHVFRDSGFDRTGFARGKLPLCMLAAEIFLAGVSWGFAKWHRPERWRTLLPSVAGVAFAATLLMQIALPMQSYVANQSSFPFTARELSLALALRFLSVFPLGALCLGVLGRRFGRLALSLAFAFAICAYLESGILSEGLPSLNGDWTLFTDRIRGVKDLAAWAGVFVVVLGLHHWLKAWLGVAGLCLALMAGASMLDAKPEAKADTSHLIVHDFSSIETVLRSAAYSTNRNVMVFIVDSLEREHAHAIMDDPEDGPGLREQFRGFTEYTNNVGACEASLPAVANLMTGKYPEYMMDQDFYASIYAGGSVLEDCLAAGYAVYCGTGSLGYGYTNRKRERTSAQTGMSIRDIHSKGNSGWGLTAFCRFRWMPFVLKVPYAWLLSMGRPAFQDVTDREKTAYPILAEGEIAENGKGSFLLVHTAGVHVPVLFNRHGEQLPHEDNTDKGFVESGIFVLKQLGTLLDDYRERGIFDNSLIIVLGDHGRHETVETLLQGTAEDFPANGRPFLWIKPPHCTHPFLSSGESTTHAKIHAVLREALRRDLDDADIQGLLHSADRVFRLGAGALWHDYHVAGDNTWRMESVEPDMGDVSKMRPVQLGKPIRLRFDVSLMREGNSVRFKGFPPKQDGGFFLGWKPVWTPLQERVSLVFKVADPMQSYRVRLVGRIWKEENAAEGGRVRFYVRGNEGLSATASEEGVLEVVLETLETDRDGTIEIICEREDECGLSLVFNQLEVTETP